MKQVVIVGASAAGSAAAEAVRRLDQTCSVILVSDEPVPLYSRCLLSDYLLGQIGLGQLVFQSWNWPQDLGVAVIQEPAVALDLAAGRVITRSGQRLPYDRLLLATGASPILPAATGLQTGNVFTLYRLDEVDAALRALARVHQVVVQGAGKVGVKAAEAVAARGIPVTLVEQASHLLPGMLDSPSASWLQQLLAARGVRVQTGTSVTGVGSRQNQVAEICLDSGARLPCDLFLVAIGGRPNISLATEVGIQANRGILVDAHMQTSEEGVFAAGDAAEASLSQSGQRSVVANWLNAVQQGRVAGRSLAGATTSYAGSVRANALRLAGLPVVSVGDVNGSGDDDWGELDKEAGTYRRLVFRDSRLIGAIQVGGDVHDVGILSSLIKSGANVAGLEASLFADSFALFGHQRGRKLMAEALVGVASSPA
jgi:nitrite reductase (NADH) large subunit